jgi:hypothetical protein
VKVSFGVDLTAIVAQLRNDGKVQTRDRVRGHPAPRSARERSDLYRAREEKNPLRKGVA